ncbi:MAG: HipA domain-containing protein, partial [Prevotella sp.]|nr:HipA domain-containing protein [Prevotella sp.]MBQ6549578.1 HipA domain-containing protein [Prevotella sp.]
MTWSGFTDAKGGTDYKYSNLSYEECGLLIAEHVNAKPVELLKFFRLVLFNFLFLNNDAHLKNFSLINRGEEYQLAPAYDLMNTSFHLSN